MKEICGKKMFWQTPIYQAKELHWWHGVAHKPKKGRSFEGPCENCLAVQTDQILYLQWVTQLVSHQ